MDHARLHSHTIPWRRRRWRGGRRRSSLCLARRWSRDALRARARRGRYRLATRAPRRPRRRRARSAPGDAVHAVLAVVHAQTRAGLEVPQPKRPFEVILLHIGSATDEARNAMAIAA